MGVTSQVRDTKELNPLVKVMLDIAIEKIKKLGITPLIVETYRTKERQYYLYGQGRTEEVCKGAGMPSVKAKKYANPRKSKCTWTLNSIHIKRCAVDLIPQRNGKAIWNANDTETIKIIKAMQNVGFEAGANWSNSPDSPHFQVDGISNSAKTFRQGNTNAFVTKTIQRQLKKAGYYKDYSIDGKWGKATTNAVKKWKKAQGWKATGNVGKTALKRLLKY